MLGTNTTPLSVSIYLQLLTVTYINIRLYRVTEMTKWL